MVETIGTGWMVHVAMLGYVLGFLFRDQVLLRSLALTGTSFYIAYYYFHPAEPLWDAIYASVAIITANLIGLGRILYSRYVLFIPKNQRSVFRAMKGLQPGEFRQLMRLGEMKIADRSVEMTIEGEQPDSLYFVAEGAAVAGKEGREFNVPKNMFIGEVSFFLNRPASASVTLPAGGLYIRWTTSRLRAALRRDPMLARAFEVVVSRDMAAKFADSVHIDALGLAMDVPLAHAPARHEATGAMTRPALS
ncbi:MAG: cyclic nucleotide-binding domain-containing protein [Pseudomonadota bacterium]